MRTVMITYTANSTNDKVPQAEEPRDRETITRGSGTAVGRVTGPLTATYPLGGRPVWSENYESGGQFQDDNRSDGGQR